jgi:hypothetical protein
MEKPVTGVDVVMRVLVLGAAEVDPGLGRLDVVIAA